MTNDTRDALVKELENILDRADFNPKGNYELRPDDFEELRSIHTTLSTTASDRGGEREALRKYGCHFATCDIHRGAALHSCTCGLLDAIKAAEASIPAPVDEGRKPVKLLFTAEGLKVKIAADPDEMELEAGASHYDAPQPRFFIDHGLIHDRMTGKHVRTDEFEGGITDALKLLNSLSTTPPEPIPVTDDGGAPFWALEDTRCEKWSPMPQYLHMAAPFYDAWPHNWGSPGGGMVLQTSSIHDARRFQSEQEAKNFLAEHGRNVGMPDSWVAREHAFIAALRRTVPAPKSDGDSLEEVAENLTAPFWQELTEKDDRTSPEEYPDMCLITREELEQCVLSALDIGKDEVARIFGFTTAPSPLGEDMLREIMADAYDKIWPKSELGKAFRSGGGRWHAQCILAAMTELARRMNGGGEWVSKDI